MLVKRAAPATGARSRPGADGSGGQVSGRGWMRVRAQGRWPAPVAFACGYRPSAGVNCKRTPAGQRGTMSKPGISVMSACATGPVGQVGHVVLLRRAASAAYLWRCPAGLQRRQRARGDGGAGGNGRGCMRAGRKPRGACWRQARNGGVIRGSAFGRCAGPSSGCRLPRRNWLERRSWLERGGPGMQARGWAGAFRSRTPCPRKGAVVSQAACWPGGPWPGGPCPGGPWLCRTCPAGP